MLYIFNVDVYVSNGYFCFAGGYDEHGQVLFSVEIYNPHTDTWVLKS